MEEKTITPENHDEKASGPAFSVHNIYLKDSSFEAPNTPHVFTEEWRPRLSFDLESSSSSVSEGIYEVILHITVTVRLGNSKDENENKVAFLIDVKQAGVFSLRGYDNEQMEKLLSITCPGTLYPYAREVVSGLVTKGGFPQLVLPPMNFDMIYQHHKKNKK